MKKSYFSELCIIYNQKYEEITSNKQNHYKLKIGFIIINCALLLYILFNSNNFNLKNMKVCVCTLGKKENRYIREFVEYYEKYGIDKIFLYDNNDFNDERFEEVIKDYIDKGFVKILNWRGQNKTMLRIWKDCYLQNYKYFDWLLFFDLDEYINLKNYENIKPFLIEKKFVNCSKIYLNWVIHTDNNLLYYDNRTLHERFPILEPNARINNTNYNASVKTILRGHIPNLKFTVMHIFDRSIKGCNAYGILQDLNIWDYMSNPDLQNYYIDHYYSKLVEEFIEKINKGDVFFENKTSFKMHRIKRFFNINDITLEKIDYIESKTGLNLTKYRNMLTKEKK